MVSTPRSAIGVGRPAGQQIDLGRGGDREMGRGREETRGLGLVLALLWSLALSGFGLLGLGWL